MLGLSRSVSDLLPSRLHHSNRYSPSPVLLPPPQKRKNPVPLLPIDNRYSPIPLLLLWFFSDRSFRWFRPQIERLSPFQRLKLSTVLLRLKLSTVLLRLKPLSFQRSRLHPTLSFDHRLLLQPGHRSVTHRSVVVFRIRLWGEESIRSCKDTQDTQIMKDYQTLEERERCGVDK
ncbi:hypothetical protein L2E82_22902 [Cichorium intybus]|uniref:Uncharacterized protein n=1 Tax=Cichorium intybus TaxID=13427 RepID=A0ACB9E033_CICIN|nr:hypothetical protein L2E82_22902 [Cichorium intybus]